MSVPDERGDLAPRNDHRVDAGSLELGDILSARVAELCDRELAGGHVVEERKQHLERILLGALLDREEEDLGVDLLERLLEGVRGRHPHDALESVRVALVPGRPVGRHDDRVGPRPARFGDAAAVEEREVRRGPHLGALARDDETLGPLRLRSRGRVGICDLDEDRDPVALGDRLAQLGHRIHATQPCRQLGRRSRRLPKEMRSLFLAGFALLASAGVAGAALIVGTNGPDRLVGTPRSDALFGRGGSDRLLGLAGADLLDGGAGGDLLEGGAGADRLAAQYDGARDALRCGPGADVVNADLADRVEPDCELVGRRLSRDPYDDPEAQHETQVEPDAVTVGRTTVAAFQVGRRFDGGATNIGFATSLDGGRTWRSGLLPGLTVASRPPGPHLRASDPVVAYEPVTGTWLVAALALEGRTTRLTVSRSVDGLRWSEPVVAAEAVAAEGIAFDKEWLVCDAGRSSPRRGTCYLVATDELQREALAVFTSTDGGASWARVGNVPVTGAVGAIPVVRPNGDLVIVFLWRGRSLGSSLSQDGGVTFSEPTVVAELRVRPARGLRFFPLPSAEVDPGGRVVVVWHDCRFSAGCARNGIVTARSADGRSWSSPAAAVTGRNAMLPTIGIHPKSGRSALAYHVVRPDGGVDVELVESLPDGDWGTPRRLSARTMRPEWMPRTRSGRMLADYISVTYAGRRPLVVWVLASEPEGARFRQAVYATLG